MALFERYIGVDDSGAQTAESSLPGLRVYVLNRRMMFTGGTSAKHSEVLGAPGCCRMALRKIWGRCPGLNRGPNRQEESGIISDRLHFNTYGRIRRRGIVR